MTFLDYTKAHFHLENLQPTIERAKNNVNSEDKSVEFLYNCMREKISEMNNFKKKYKNIKSSFFSNYGRFYKIESEKTFYIFKTMEDLLKFLNKNKKFSEANIIRNISVFVNQNNKLYLPENEIQAINKDYLYIGKYNVIID